ncbi:MAG: hypothetical protein DMF90_13670 [Acidobacteria bacterium]|nr:MAG: hypothetical protein DMF90_13670 [Acidobacteriota bacterium]
MIASQCGAPQRASSGDARVYRREACILQFPLLHGAMERELLAQVALELASPEEIPRTPKQF